MLNLDTTAPYGISPADIPDNPDERRDVVVRLADAIDQLNRAAEFWTQFGDIAHHAAERRDEYLPKIPASYVGPVGNDHNDDDASIGIHLGFTGTASLIDGAVANSLSTNAELSSQRAYGIASAARRELERLTRGITMAFGEDWKPEFDTELAKHRAEMPVDLPAGFTRR